MLRNRIAGYISISSIINMLDKQGQRCQLPCSLYPRLSLHPAPWWLCMINVIIINFGHVNCACQKFKQVCSQPQSQPHPRSRTRNRTLPPASLFAYCTYAVWNNIQLRKAGSRAGRLAGRQAIRVSGIIKNASVSLGLGRNVQGKR